jgi:hypothetical protein
LSLSSFKGRLRQSQRKETLLRNVSVLENKYFPVPLKIHLSSYSLPLLLLYRSFFVILLSFFGVNQLISFLQKNKVRKTFQKAKTFDFPPCFFSEIKTL